VKRILIAFSLLSLVVAPAAAQEKLSPGQAKQIEEVVREYLLRNPKVLVEAMRALEQKRRDEASAAQREAVKKSTKELYEDTDSFVAGNPRGDVTIVEFFDYHCPYCKQAKPELDAAIKRDGKVRVILKELPVLGPDSVLASRAAIAVLRGQPAKYLAMHNGLMESRGTLTEPVIMQVAREAGVDTNRLKLDMADPRVGATIERNLKLAHELLIDGTPAFVLGDRIIPGAIPAGNLLAAIAELRKTRAQ
jgi:protein-disulfide isomerase